MSQMQGSFLFNSASALRLHPFMAKLHYRASQYYSGPSVLPGIVDTYRQCSQVKFREARAASLVLAGYPKVGQNFQLFRTLDNGCTRNATATKSNLTAGLLSCKVPGSVFSCGLSSGFGLSYSYLSFSKRYFSEVSALETKAAKTGVRGGSRRPWVWKKKNKAKGVVANSSNRDTDSSSTLASKDVTTATSSKQTVKGQKKGAENGSTDSTSLAGKDSQDSKVNEKQKKQPRTKKKKEKVSSVITSKEADAVGGSKSISPKKKSNVEETAENLNENMPVEVLDSSASMVPRSNKKNGQSNRKRKPTKTAIESPLEHKPVDMGKIKSMGQKPFKPLYPPTCQSVMVVESVTKAKVIQGYLGDMFEVLPSHGHVRDLAARSGSVRPDDDFSMVWEVPSSAWTHLKSIKAALNGAKNLILASDPDREGEAIAWHIFEMLQQQDALHEETTVARVVFHEITEASIKSALKAPREIDPDLVQAYLARRALDYLIGFNISPLLWRKLPGCQSAGRVQSAALSLICDRELEIDEFKPQEYWTIEAVLKTRQLVLKTRKPYSLVGGFSFPAHLTHFNSKKLGQFSISSDSEAKDIEMKINSTNFQVVASKRNTVRRNPPTPYITSTLQQDAVNKFNFSAAYTMKLAQQLYEGIQLSDDKAMGLITYIRTDGLHISDEAVKDIRSLVMERYGSDFAPENARKYFKKVKNAQEAHEAIRPTDIRRLPSMLVEILEEDCLKLYSLIWARTMACQMEPASIEQVQLEIGNDDGSIVFRSSCPRLLFLGYQAVYQDVEAEAIGVKDNEGTDRAETFEILNSLKQGDLLSLGEVELQKHYTQPPPRYSEGSLVRKLEELGIGRPSTYATTLKVLQDRNYVMVKSRILYPEFRGRMVSAFLSHHFSEVTDYSFTADMESELDNVSAGLTEWKGLLKDYWTRFKSYCSHTESVHIHQVEKMLEKTFEDFLFASLPDKNRTCPSCMEGTLIFKVSRFGAGYFIGCNQHPSCKYIAKTLYGDDEDEDTPQKSNTVEEPKMLGLHPSSNEKVFLKSGPYGHYVQLGEDRTGYLPKRSSVSHIKNVNSITLEDALDLLRYPVTLGNHPKDGQPVVMKLAKFGFSIRHRRTIASVPKNMNPNDVTLEKALEFLSSKNVRQSGRPKNKPKVEEAMEVL
ncbi:hypothetical protein SLE2022_033040 [Rubroshorea leprosula]